MDRQSLLQTPALTKEDNLELLKEYNACSDEDEKSEIFDRLFLGNCRLVNERALYFENKIQPKIDDEYFIAGCHALYKAIEDFDVENGAAFSTFARTYIDNEIREYITKNLSTIKVPKELIPIKKVRDFLKQKLERNPTPEEIAEEMDGKYTPEQIAQFLTQIPYVLSTDTKIDDDSDATFNDIIADDSIDSDPAENCRREEDAKHLEEALNSLAERNKTILIEHERNGVPYKILSERFGISQERVRQIIEETKEEIRDYFKKKHYKY